MRMLYPHSLPTTVFIALVTLVHSNAEDSAERNICDHRISYVDLRRDFRMGYFDTFFSRIKTHIHRILECTKPGIGIGPFEAFVDALVMMKIPMEHADLEARQIVIRDEAINVFEFPLTSANSSEGSPTKQSTFKCLNYLNQGLDVVCWKVNRLAASVKPRKVMIDWKVEKFTQEGALIKTGDSQTAAQNKERKI